VTADRGAIDVAVEEQVADVGLGRREAGVPDRDIEESLEVPEGAVLVGIDQDVIVVDCLCLLVEGKRADGWQPFQKL
jgi:hypothetical protein